MVNTPLPFALIHLIPLQYSVMSKRFVLHVSNRFQKCMFYKCWPLYVITINTCMVNPSFVQTLPASSLTCNNNLLRQILNESVFIKRYRFRFFVLTVYFPIVYICLYTGGDQFSHLVAVTRSCVYFEPFMLVTRFSGFSDRQKIFFICWHTQRRRQ